MEAYLFRYGKDGSIADKGIPFTVREPVLSPGDLLIVRIPFVTFGGQRFYGGDKLHLARRTKEAPFDLACSLGNWVVAPPWQEEIRKEDIWSNIDSMYTSGYFDLFTLPLKSVWDRLNEDEFISSDPAA